MNRCCYCKKGIPDKDIPEEAKGKIGMQMFWHEACVP